jgi:hypothetical protein
MPSGMVSLGYFLSCEEFPPDELVRQAVRAEAAGFDEVYIQQIGSEQDRYFDFWESEIAPEFAA